MARDYETVLAKYAEKEIEEQHTPMTEYVKPTLVTSTPTPQARPEFTPKYIIEQMCEEGDPGPEVDFFHASTTP